MRTWRVVNYTIPPFTGDLKAINEKAIRHDTGLAIEHGFAGTLGVSEVAITLSVTVCSSQTGVFAATAR